MDDKHAGLLCVLLASVMWALEPVFAKLSYKNSNFFQTSLIRAIFAFIIALIYAGWKKANFRLDKKQAPVLIYIAIAGTVFADLMYFFALTQVPVINAVLIGHMQPLFVILIGFVLLKGEKLTKIADFSRIIC
ncbi:MAG: DMT family transporter [Thermoplasmata archaeon]|nr:DMT family transporter [Thermoplasmata archaeon]